MIVLLAVVGLLLAAVVVFGRARTRGAGARARTPGVLVPLALPRPGARSAPHRFTGSRGGM